MQFQRSCNATRCHSCIRAGGAESGKIYAEYFNDFRASLDLLFQLQQLWIGKPEVSLMLPHFHWRTTVPHRAIHLRFVACSAESAIESAAAASLIKLQLRKRFPPATRKLHFSIPRNLFAIWMSRQMTGKIAMRMIWPNEIWFEGVKLSAAKGRFTTCFLVSLYTITHTRTHTHTSFVVGGHGKFIRSAEWKCQISFQEQDAQEFTEYCTLIASQLSWAF